MSVFLSFHPGRSWLQCPQKSHRKVQQLLELSVFYTAWLLLSLKKITLAIKKERKSQPSDTVHFLAVCAPEDLGSRAAPRGTENQGGQGSWGWEGVEEEK